MEPACPLLPHARLLGTLAGQRGRAAAPLRPSSSTQTQRPPHPGTAQDARGGDARRLDLERLQLEAHGGEIGQCPRRRRRKSGKHNRDEGDPPHTNQLPETRECHASPASASGRRAQAKDERYQPSKGASVTPSPEDCTSQPLPR